MFAGYVFMFGGYGFIFAGYGFLFVLFVSGFIFHILSFPTDDNSESYYQVDALIFSTNYSMIYLILRLRFLFWYFFIW